MTKFGSSYWLIKLSVTLEQPDEAHSSAEIIERLDDISTPSSETRGLCNAPNLKLLEVNLISSFIILIFNEKLSPLFRDCSVMYRVESLSSITLGMLGSASVNYGRPAVQES